MAKRKPKPAPEAAPKSHSNKLIYAVLFAIAVLIIIAIIISTQTNNADATAWATIRSTELHNFMSNCRSGGGTVDVRPNSAPAIIFSCVFSDRQVEYTLQPAK